MHPPPPLAYMTADTAPDGAHTVHVFVPLFPPTPLDSAGHLTASVDPAFPAASVRLTWRKSPELEWLAPHVDVGASPPAIRTGSALLARLMVAARAQTGRDDLATPEDMRAACELLGVAEARPVTLRPGFPPRFAVAI